MATTIQIKRGTGTAAPGTLVAGELAATLGAGTQSNAGDRLFIGDGSNVDVIGGKYFTDMLDQAHGTLTAASTVIVDSSKRIDEVIVGNNATTGGSIQFREGTNNGDHYMALKAPNAVTASITLTLPDGAGSNGQYLQTNGSDTLAWNTVVSTFNIGADSGSDDTVNTGQLVNFTGGTGIGTTVADNEVTFAIDATVATLTGSQTLTNKTINASNNTISNITNAMLSGSAGITNANLDNTTTTVGTTAITLGGSSTTLAGLTQVDVDNIRMADNTISTTDADGDLVLSPNGSGDIDANTSKIINVTDPTQDQDAATKAYVDATSNGLDVKASCDVATTADLAYTYSNGTAGVGATLTNPSSGPITIDGIALTANMRVLVKDQEGGDADQNGIYYVSTAGASGVALVLTRATDADTAAKLTGGAFTFVEQGSTQQDNGYVFTHDGSPTIGTTNLPVSQFSGAGQITPGTGLTKSGNTINAIGSTTIIANADSLEVNSSGTNHQILRSGGSAGTAATFGQLALNQSAAVTGTLGYANGGTGLATFAKGSVLVANADDTLTALDGGGSNDGILFYTQGTDEISWATSLDGGSF